MANEWSGLVNTTIPKHIRQTEDATIRSHYWLAELKKRGRITFNHSGREMDWRVKFKRNGLTAYVDGQTLGFSRKDRYKIAALDWRGYYVEDAMTEMERLQNKGTEAIIQRYAKIIPDLLDDMKEGFGAELYVDGYSASNTNRIHGINSMMGTGTNAAGDQLGQPDDTYAGLDTDLQAYGGTWSTDLSTKPNATVATDWPDGSGSVEYDFWSPKLVNWSANNYGTSLTTWVGNCERAMRRASSWANRTSGMKPDVFMLASNLFYDYKNFEAGRQRIVVPHKGAQDLGFGDVLNFDGVALAEDFNAPAGDGYGLVFNEMELCCLTDELFNSKGPTWVHDRLAWLFSVHFYGNLKFKKPRAFSKLKAYA